MHAYGRLSSGPDLRWYLDPHNQTLSGESMTSVPVVSKGQTKVAGSGSDLPSVAMNADDAVYAAVVYWYGQEVCLAHGEKLTSRAAENIRAIAASFQVRAARTALELGFDFDAERLWPLEAIRIAKNCVRRSGRAEQVQRVCAAIADLKIDEVEGYSETYP